MLMLVCALLPVQASSSAAVPKMKVTYHPEARRPYDPAEPAGTGDPPCSRFPTSGVGTLRYTRDGLIEAPRLRSKKKGDVSVLTSKTRPFSTFLAECIISTEGHVTEVRVLRGVSDEFDHLILAELGSSVYEPATLDGTPVSVCYLLTARPHP